MKKKTIFGGSNRIKPCKSVVMLTDFPINRALFELLYIHDPVEVTSHDSKNLKGPLYTR